MNRHLFFWSLVVVGGHAAYLDTPFVNQEFAFSEAARSLRDPAYTLGIWKYWEVQANPLGYSLALAALTAGLGLDITFWSARLPSLLGCLLLLLAGRLAAGPLALRPALFSLWAGVTALNPLLWLYTGQGTADILPVGLMALAFWCCAAAAGRLPHHLLGGLCFSLALLMKFPSLLLGLGFLYLLARSGGRGGALLAGACCYTLLPAAVLGAYFACIWQAYHVFLIAERFKSIHFASSYAGYFVPIFFAYVSYLALALGPLVLAAPIRVWLQFRWRSFVLVTAMAVIVAAIAVPLLAHFELGEMDFGGLGHVLPPSSLLLFRLIGLGLSVFLAADLLHAAWRRSDHVAAFTVSAVVPFLVVCALSRPAQRYLLFCIPLLLFYLAAAARAGQRSFVILAWLTLVCSLPINVLSASFQIAQGQAAERMAQWVGEQGYLGRTNPGSIYGHAGQHFPHLHSESPNEFTITTEPPLESEALHFEPVRLLGRTIYAHYLYRTPAR